MPFVPSSCLLFHGPGAETKAWEAANGFGKLIPFDGSALKKDGARDLVEIIASFPVGSGAHSVLVGPVDYVTPAVSDTLLKTLEEFNPRGVRPFLWAWDLGGVSMTIRSRCVCQDSPGTDSRLETYRNQARDVVKAFLASDWTSMVEIWKESKGDEIDILRAVVDQLPQYLESNPLDTRIESLWVHIRPMTNSQTLTPARIISAFLESSS